MTDGDRAVKSTAQVDQNTAIKSAVDALGKNNQDTQKLLSLLTSCSSETEKKEVLKKVQEVFRQQFGKEVSIERDKASGKDVVKTKNWVAGDVDFEALSTVAEKIVKKLWANPSAKVELDSWLQTYNEYISVGKLQWLKEYAKNTLDQEISLKRENGKLVATLTHGAIKLPSIPTPALPAALRREEQKGPQEKPAVKKAAEEPSIWSKIVDFAAPIGTALNSAADVLKHPIDSTIKAATAIDNFLGKPVQTLNAKVIQPVWSGLSELADNLIVKIQSATNSAKDFLGIKQSESGQDKVAKSAEVESSVDENGDPIFRVAVTEKLEKVSKTAKLKLPPVPQEPSDVNGEGVWNEKVPSSIQITLPIRPEPSVLTQTTLPTFTPDNSIAPQISGLKSIKPSSEFDLLMHSIQELPLYNISRPSSIDILVESICRTFDFNSSTYSLGNAPAVLGGPDETIAETVKVINRAVEEKRLSTEKAEEFIKVLYSGVSPSAIQYARDILRQLNAGGAAYAQLDAAISRAELELKMRNAQKAAA